MDRSRPRTRSSLARGRAGGRAAGPGAVTGNGLQDGCYHCRANRAPANELVWGDFHLLDALLALAGELDPLVC
jgi:hypothetical protein